MTPAGVKKKLLTEINMIPFIDIVLVLLIIFMVVTPMLEQSEIPVRLPESTSGKAVPEDKLISVLIVKNGDTYIQKERVMADDLESRMRDSIRREQAKSVLIEADKRVPFEHVVRVLDAADRMGDVKVGVSVRPADEKR